MKRFFMCCVVVIVALFLGFTAYYFIANQEKISLASGSSASIKLNVGDTLNLNDVIKHEQPSSNTVIDVDFSVDGVLSYNPETKVFTAEKVGSTVVVLTPSNTKFGPFVLNANVDDGRSAEFPYYIRTADELASIGKSGSLLTNMMSYELVSDIYLTNRVWVPIAQGGEYKGTFNGANHVIYDMSISTNATHGGLFAKVASGAVVKNITIVNAQIQGEFTYAGVIAGENNGLITLCLVLESQIVNGGSATGGIVGYNNFTQTANGGLSARVALCGVEKSLLSGAGDMGGIVGANKGSIVESCYAVLDSVDGLGKAKFSGVVGQNIGYNGSFTKASTIYKSYAYAKAVSNTAQTSGLVAVNQNASTSAENSFVYNLFVMDTNNIIGTQTAVETTKVAKQTVDTLKNQATYLTWDFNRIWKMTPNYAVIDFGALYFTNIPDTIVVPDGSYPDDPEVPGGSGSGTGTGSGSGSGSGSGTGTGSGSGTGTGSGSGTGTGGTFYPEPKPMEQNTTVISSANVWYVLNEMKLYPQSGKVYVFRANLTIEANQNPYKNLFPIASADKPLNCTIRPESGSDAVLTFTNINISGVDNASMFGHLGSGAKLEGIVVKNAKVTGNSTTNAGILSTYVGTGAEISNCKVQSSTLNGYNQVGAIASVNYGENTSNVVQSTTINSEVNANVGIFVGNNFGTIEGAKSISNKINLNSSSWAGGITGYSEGNIKNAQVSDLKINGKNSSFVYAGGIAGYSTKKIEKSIVSGSEIAISTTAKDCYVGGIVALNYGTIVSNKVLSTDIEGYYAGGLVGLNRSVIQKSIADENYSGKVSGIYAGGLVAMNQAGGDISNCVVGTRIVAIQGSKNMAGFAYKLDKNSVISNCFSYAKFENTTNVGTKNLRAIANSTQSDTVKDCYVCNVNGLDIMDNFFGNLFGWGQSDYELAEEDVKKANSPEFFEKNFSKSIWITKDGQWPTVKI